jgi:AcrR family transcriptional regulator
MGRPSTIRDEQILDAARKEFLKKGISATTADVARRAGVAEGSIFNRWKTKDELFVAAMATPADGVPAWIENLLGSIGKGDVRDNLHRAAVEGITFFRQIMPLMMMAWSNPKSGHSHYPPRNPMALRALRTLTPYFEAEMRLGRLRRHDPAILARVFGGGLQNFVFFELITKAEDEVPPPVETYLAGFFDLLWNGAAPLPPRRRTRKEQP